VHEKAFAGLQSCRRKEQQNKSSRFSVFFDIISVKSTRKLPWWVPHALCLYHNYNANRALCHLASTLVLSRSGERKPGSRNSNNSPVLGLCDKEGNPSYQKRPAD